MQAPDTRRRELARINSPSIYPLPSSRSSRGESDIVKKYLAAASESQSSDETGQIAEKVIVSSMMAKLKELVVEIEATDWMFEK